MNSHLLRLTLANPAAAMAYLLDQRLPLGPSLQVVTLGAVLSTLSTCLALIVQPFPDPLVNALVLNNPIIFAISGAVAAVLLAFSLFRLGAAFGGQGDFAGACLLMGWLQVVMVVLQLAELLAIVLLPAVIGVVVSIAALGVVIWVAVGMTGALHRFANTGLAVGTLIGAFVMTILGMALLAMLIGTLSGGGA
jgi:hypothetical protein